MKFLKNLMPEYETVRSEADNILANYMKTDFTRAFKLTPGADGWSAVQEEVK